MKKYLIVLFIILSFSSCTKDNDNRIELNSATLTGGPYEFLIDGRPDYVSNLVLDVGKGLNGDAQGFVITDASNIILGLPKDMEALKANDFDGAGEGTCLIYHINYLNGISGLEQGKDLDGLKGSYKLSDPITVKRTNIVLNSAILTGGPYEFVIDGKADHVSDLGLEAGDGLNGDAQSFIITDASNIILGLPKDMEALRANDFESLGIGNYLIHHLVYLTGITNFQVGKGLEDLDGFFALSNSIAVTNIENPGLSSKVLFLGNSYTAANNLPAMIGYMATSTGDELIHDQNTPGGAWLVKHAQNNTSVQKINSDNWDYVVLQGQSLETSYSIHSLETITYPHAKTLSDLIKTNGSIPMFFMTWGRKNGLPHRCGSLLSPWNCTYEGMDDYIRNTYETMAEDNKALLSPIGAVRRYIRENHPEIELYTGDGSHPSLAGSYAAACTFYAMIFKKDPTLITWDSSLSEQQANILKQAAKIVAFDKINDWDYTE